MTETAVPATQLASQYISQVTGDLERNAEEQERITEEIAGLQEQLVALQRDHSVLVNMRQALGVTPPPADSETASDRAAVPALRKKSSTESGTGSRARTKKAAAGPKRAADRTADRKPAKAASTPPARPTLVELTRRHLAEQSEPRSAAEVATALGQAHPDRNIKITVVRTTLEGLVAKNQAQRTKQGTSVFYCPTDAPQSATSKDKPQNGSPVGETR